MRALVVVATYNEALTISTLCEKVLYNQSAADILIIDDNSPDGTGAIAERIAAIDERVHTLHRSHKTGLCSAVLAGFKWGLAEKYDVIVNLDADLSHDPTQIGALVDALETSDFVVGSRYVQGGRIKKWPIHRRFLSRFASAYTRILTRLPLKDPTSGFRAIRSAVLRPLLLDPFISSGYFFHVEFAHRAFTLGLTCKEVPISFTDRTLGHSKLDLKEIVESATLSWKLAPSRFKSAYCRAV